MRKRARRRRDTCWEKGFAFDPSPFTAVPNGTWTVKKNNTWEFDYVGIGAGLIAHYRARGRVPCVITLPQRMVITCSTTNRAYLTDTLKITVDKATISNERAGVETKK
jgi:hypothetical protein